MSKEKYLTLYHHNSSTKTLADFMEISHIPTSVISVDDLFEMNRSAIFSQMSLDEKADYAESLGKDSITEGDLKSDMTLPFPCVLKIEAKYVKYELAISQTNFQENTDDLYAFENEQILNILQNEGYVIDRSTKKVAPECSVFGWFKSLYYAGGLDNFSSIFFRSTNNKFIDISDYIVNVTTNVTADGGTFSITLPIINSIEQLVHVNPEEFSKIPILKAFTYSDRSAQQIDLYKYGKFFFHKGGMLAMDKNYFNWLIQSNDLIFISFEKMEMEKNLGVNVFDMIGLVDSVVVNQNANGQGSVTVTGRDLMKLLTDDSSLFFNNSAVCGESQIFANTESSGKQGDIRDADMKGSQESGPINRLRRATNQIDIFAAPINRSLEFIMKGVISQLANIEVVPDYVFEDWGDRRTRFAEIYPDVSSNTSGTADGALSGGGDTGEQPEPNKAFSSGIKQNANKDKYSPTDGSGNGQGKSDTPSLPLMGDNYLGDGIYLQIK